VPVFLKGLRTKFGKVNAITSTEMIAKIRERYDVELSDVLVRTVINHIRNHDLLPGLVAGSGGYYITSDPREVKKYIDSLNGREQEIRRIKEGMQAYLKKLVTGKQSNFFTKELTV
jgi:hypothetical protein